MLARFRWYHIQLPRGIPDLASVIDDHPLSQDTNQGFTRVNGVLGNFIHRFLWRSKVVVTQFDENGDPVYQEVETVNFTDFATIKIGEFEFLRIENPGRSIRNLLNALESMMGLGFTCQLITFEKQKPTTVFEDVEVAKLIGLKVSGAVLDKDLIANMEFSSNEGITPEKLTILTDVPYKTDLASYELIYGGIRGFLSFNSNGTIKVSGQLAPRLIHKIEQDLGKIGA